MALKIDLHPLITEKSVKMQEDNVVVFSVRSEANKNQIAQAVIELYKVKPLKVRTVPVRPRKRRRGATVGKTAGWKKAYVTVDNVQAIGGSSV